MGYLKKARAFLVEGLWTVPLESLSGPQAFLVRLLRLITVSFKDFSEGLISLRAMSLVYTTLLSLVPLLAVSFSVLKGFGVHNQIEPVLANFLAPLGPKGQELTTKIIGFVENLNVGVLGSLGLAFLLYTVISLVQKIEGAFNEIWHVRRSRSFSRRISDYLSLILVGPVLVFSGLGLAASITGTALVKKVLEVEAVGTALLMAGKLVPFLVVCAAFSFIYLFIPSTKVHLKSALVGGRHGGGSLADSGNRIRLLPRDIDQVRRHLFGIRHPHPLHDLDLPELAYTPLRGESGLLSPVPSFSQRPQGGHPALQPSRGETGTGDHVSRWSEPLQE